MVPHDASDDGPLPTRRAVLATGATALGALAGCQSGLPPLSGGVTYGRVDVPEPEPPVYRRWAPDPTLLDAHDDGDVPEIIHAAPRRSYDILGRVPGLIGLSIAMGHVDYLGHPLSLVERVILVGEVRVLTGPFDRESVVRALRAGEYERTTAYEGWDVYERPTNRLAAVGDGAVCWTDHPDGGNDVRRVIDAKAGRVDRYHEVDDAFRALSAGIGASVDTVFMFGAPDPTDQAITGAISTRPRRDASYFIAHSLYPPGVTIPVDAIEEELSKVSHFGEADAVEVQAHGRIASVERRVPNDRLREDDQGPYRPPIPWITWEQELDGNTVVFRHLAGDPIPVEALSVDVHPGRNVRDPWPDRTEAVGPGDELRIAVSDPSSLERVRLVYHPSDDSTMTIASLDLEADDE